MLAIVCSLVSIVCAVYIIKNVINLYKQPQDLFDFTAGNPKRKLFMIPSSYEDDDFTIKHRVLHKVSRKECKKYARKHGRKIEYE